MTREEAEKRALELYPVNFWRNLPEFDTGLNQREAYLKCWEDMQPKKVDLKYMDVKSNTNTDFSL